MGRSTWLLLCLDCQRSKVRCCEGNQVKMVIVMDAQVCDSRAVEFGVV